MNFQSFLHPNKFNRSLLFVIVVFVRFLRGRKTRQTESFPSAHNRQWLVGPGLEPRNSVPTSHVGSRNAITWAITATSQSALAGSWNQELEPGSNAGTAVCKADIFALRLNVYTLSLSFDSIFHKLFWRTCVCIPWICYLWQENAYPNFLRISLGAWDAFNPWKDAHFSVYLCWYFLGCVGRWQPACWQEGSSDQQRWVCPCLISNCSMSLASPQILSSEPQFLNNILWDISYCCSEGM